MGQLRLDRRRHAGPRWGERSCRTCHGAGDGLPREELTIVGADGVRRISRRRLLAFAGGAAAAGFPVARGWPASSEPERTHALTVPGLAARVSNEPSPPGSASATTRVGEVLSPSGVLFGAWTPGAPWELTSVTEIENEIQQRLGIVMWYQGWGAENAALDTRLLDKVAAHGARPMITWEAWDYTKGVEQPVFKLARIADGAFDEYARSWAEGLRAWGKPVILRWAHEMNHPRYPWSVGVNGNTVADFHRAWRRLRGIFREAGADNVTWLWCPTIDWPGSGKHSFADLYPGDDVVELVGVDGYNGGTAVDWGGWQSFDEVFGHSIERLRALTSRPIVIGEVGCAEEGGDKGAWVEHTLSVALPGAFADIRGVVWFNQRLEADWRLQSSAAPLLAARRSLQSQHYAGATLE